MHRFGLSSMVPQPPRPTLRSAVPAKGGASERPAAVRLATTEARVPRPPQCQRHELRGLAAPVRGTMAANGALGDHGRRRGRQQLPAVPTSRPRGTPGAAADHTAVEPLARAQTAAEAAPACARERERMRSRALAHAGAARAPGRRTRARPSVTLGLVLHIGLFVMRASRRARWGQARCGWAALHRRHRVALCHAARHPQRPANTSSVMWPIRCLHISHSACTCIG